MLAHDRRSFQKDEQRRPQCIKSHWLIWIRLYRAGIGASARHHELLGESHRGQPAGAYNMAYRESLSGEASFDVIFTNIR